MKQLRLLLALVFIAALVAVNPASAEQQDKHPQRNGKFRLSVHTHSADDPEFSELLFDTKRLAFNFKRWDTFSYSSRQCELSAPFNDVGLEFDPDYPGIKDPARVRHLAQGTIVRGDSHQGTVQGTITTVLCEPKPPPNGGTETDDVIFIGYRGHYRQVSENEVRIRGFYKIFDGTGKFEELRGHGSLAASLTCLASLRDPSKPSCKDRGHFTDFVGLRGNLTARPGEHEPGLVGRYRVRP